MSASTKARRAKATKPPADYENQRYGVFVECPDDSIAPVLLRQCSNRYEAYGWREFWKVDGYIEAKMRIRPIDADGNPIAAEAESEAIHE